MARMTSSQVVLFTALFLFTGSRLFLFIILLDFIVRAFRKPELSLFSMTGKFILSGFSVTPKPCDESPKRFALYLGLGTSLLALLFSAFGFDIASYAVAGILLVCASLEAVFDFCIGCRIYYALLFLKVIKYDGNFN